jgi:hypothetical protein
MSYIVILMSFQTIYSINYGLITLGLMIWTALSKLLNRLTFND